MLVSNTTRTTSFGPLQLKLWSIECEEVRLDNFAILSFLHEFSHFAWITIACFKPAISARSTLTHVRYYLDDPVHLLVYDSWGLSSCPSSEIKPSISHSATADELLLLLSSPTTPPPATLTAAATFFFSSSLNTEPVEYNPCLSRSFSFAEQSKLKLHHRRASLSFYPPQFWLAYLRASPSSVVTKIGSTVSRGSTSLFPLVRTDRALVRKADQEVVDMLPRSVEIVIGEVGDPATLKAAIEGCNKIIYCATARSTITGDLFRVDHLGVYNLCKAFQDYNNKLAQLHAGKSSKSKLVITKFKSLSSLDGWEVRQRTYFQDVVATKYDGGMDAKFEFTENGEAVFSGYVFTRGGFVELSKKLSLPLGSTLDRAILSASSSSSSSSSNSDVWFQSSVMEKNLSPVMQQELANLDKDPDSRKSAMKALKSYVKDLDCKAIPVFLAKVSQTKETGSLSGEFTISLYEVLARVHQVKIVPMIDSIMVSIVQTLASSAGSFPLHQACSKVVLAIARYGIEPTAPEDKKRQIIHSICKPLCDSLSSSQDSLTSGAALCLKALVDSDNWRFASSEMVNRVCQNVAVGLWHWRESPLKPMLTWVWLCRW
ncbi:uncharacterized protein DS421_20g694960 [Arachis hypogaea]|nr:uncharacterized protein DS421_20g694960 [Arachis hypogaea]